MLLQKIGSGSFADVWKAQHRVTTDVVAIKEIATDRLNRRLRQSLESEVSILRRISHRNIVQLYTVIEVRSPAGQPCCASPVALSAPQHIQVESLGHFQPSREREKPWRFPLG